MIGFVKGDDMKGGQLAPVEGQHSNLDKSSVFVTSPNAITPDNPGSWKVFRFAPNLTEARTITPDEADALNDLADESEKLVVSTRKGYRALKRMSGNSRKVNESFEKLRRVQAGDEHKIQAGKNDSAKYLHGLRPKYAHLGQGLEKTAAIADQKINALMSAL